MKYSRPPPAPPRPRRPLGKPCRGCGAPDDGGHTCSYCRSPMPLILEHVPSVAHGLPEYSAGWSIPANPQPLEQVKIRK